MEKRIINPTPWLQAFNINHGVEVSGAARTLYLSGQTATSADGVALHPGDLRSQFAAAWSNLKDALAAADMGPENIARINIYTTHMDAFMSAAEELVAHFARDEARLACTLVGVTSLYDPSIMIELEAIAAA